MNRVVPGVLMAVGWLILLLFGSFQLFWVIIAAGGMVALFEFFRMTEPELSLPKTSLLLIVAALPFFAASAGNNGAVLAGLVASFLCLVIFLLFFYSHLPDVLRVFSHGALAICYIGLCTAHLVLLHTVPAGSSWLVLLTAVTAGSDTGAYYAGRAFGRKKLCPAISPGKTIAGAIGGICAGVMAAQLARLALAIPVSFPVLCIVAILLVLVGIAGDLIESVIKRSVGIKDSGTLLGGHGGLLDRIDSLLLTAPVLYSLLFFGLLG